MKGRFHPLLAKPAMAFFKRFDFVDFLTKLSKREPGASYAARPDLPPPAFPDQEDIARLAVDLAERSLAEKGEPVGRRELETQASIISCRYDADLHQMLRGAAMNIISQLFESRDQARLFTSNDGRELKNFERLKKAGEEGRGVVYLINHSSHWDEFIFNVFLDQNNLAMPLFAAGQNMMATPSLTRLFMVGSYVIVRSGAGRAYLSTLYHYCQALGELGKPQGIVLEAWSGGARTRDGSLRYPRRLIALQGALAARNDVLVQPVVISYSRVPEDLGLSEGEGLASWLNGNHCLGEVLKRPWEPKESVIRGLKNLFGRTYVGFGRGRLVSELAAEQAESGPAELTLDEYASLYAIKEIARDKKIMTSQVAARSLLGRGGRAAPGTGRAGKTVDLAESAVKAMEEIRDYHRRTFSQEPDFEDFFQEHTLEEALKDGLESLKARKVIGRRPLFSKRLPKIKAPHGLAYYATHADRRLYSPSAKENFVVCGSEAWAFGLVSYLGRRTLSDKKYNNSSLTLYDRDEAAMAFLAYERTQAEKFPGYRLPKNIFPTHDHTAAFRKATEVIVAVPPWRVDEMLKIILTEARELRSLIIASRGFDPQSHRLTMQIAWEAAVSAGRPKIDILALNGPFSPNALIGNDGGLWTLAGPVRGGRASEALLFKFGSFRVSTSPDPIGVQTAAALADAYALYGHYVERQRKLRSQPFEAAAFLREVSAEAKSLTLALGGQPQTFEADNPAWISEFIIRSLSGAGPSPAWLNTLKSDGAGEGAPARRELAEAWPDPWAAGYFSIHSAYLTAKHLGLTLPHLEEANRLFWSQG
ncbi:MAG: 1-acyl-sn-glycerol-3-phosphate acyltransferase [Candidatus Adiutrix sp.]|jgi:glycerol-3-phosphate dehydrogenase|nr:1-acyl-sn-glycerol-3-phosphate acyltransferase [Candidatus Adiutrix sp.]